MRVLDTYNGQFVEVSPRDPDTKYAILSHTWDSEGEQTLQDLRVIQALYISSEHQILPNLAGGAQPPTPSQFSTTIIPVNSTLDHSEQLLNSIWASSRLSPKIREACRVARENGYRYLWIDSCCIDKTSSSELSESINSMYQWYARADVCYAFLARVPAGEPKRHEQKGSRFRRSRWFRRGWTLQELLAPVDVVFLAEDWTEIGTKHSLADLISEITNIDYNALCRLQSLDKFSIAQRFSWAAERETTRVEDRAYSLLGIFDINMPTLYGEGERAFRRLQEEIMRRTPDQSLFAWTLEGLPEPTSNLHDPETAYANKDRRRFRFDMSLESSSFLAPSLNFFRKCAGIEALPHNEVANRLQLPNNDLPTTNYDFTPYGIRVRLPTISFMLSNYFPPECKSESIRMPADVPFCQWHLVILQCAHKDFPGHLLGRICYTKTSESNIELLYPGRLQILWSRLDLLPMSPTTITRLHSSHISSKTLYIPQPRREEVDEEARQRPHKVFNLLLPKKTREALNTQGYMVTLESPENIHLNTHLLTLAHPTHTITINYKHTFKDPKYFKWKFGDAQLTVEAFVVVESEPASVQPTWGSGVAVPSTGAGASGSEVVKFHTTKAVDPWTDNPDWREELGLRVVKLNIQAWPETLTVQLGLRFATTNYYFLRIQVEQSSTRGRPTVVSRHHVYQAGAESVPSGG